MKLLKSVSIQHQLMFLAGLVVFGMIGLAALQGWAEGAPAPSKRGRAVTFSSVHGVGGGAAQAAYIASSSSRYLSTTTRRLTLRVGVNSPSSMLKSRCSRRNFFTCS